MSNVLTWAADPSAAGAVAISERLRALQRSHHAMWNYVTYRDAIALVGEDADVLYPEGTTRLPADWADLGWLTCFCGPPASAVAAMRDAVQPRALDMYAPDLIEPLRDAAAGVLGRARDATFEVVGTEGAQAGLALALMATVDPGDEVILGDPGYFHLPSAVIAAGARPVPVALGADTGYRLDPDRVAAAMTPRTRAICLVDPVNPYGTAARADEVEALARLAERHGALLVDDVTHGPLAIDPASALHPAVTLSEQAVATFSVSHCYGMAGARIGFLAGPRALMRGCLQLKAALTRLNTNPISQRGALAALRDADYLEYAQTTIRANLAHLEETLRGVDGVELVVRPERGLACALDVAGTGASAQELMVALFARRVAVYPGDGLGERAAARTVRLNLSNPEPRVMAHVRAVLGEAVAEAASGRWREPVAALLDGKGTDRAARLAARIRDGRLDRSPEEENVS
ncbi:MAG: arginine:pyruvate transaminase [Solirubrobacteraceae bacterium]|jgi:aspartate/methionine/tyrosine aminotransferase|nr:arginine:pyruvate transaminase [Solirubrobacteraceae bacterium]